MKHSGIKTKQGFTLVETVIAMGIITIMITAFLAAFGPAVQGIRKSMSAKEANRLATTLENELSVLRPDEAGTSGYDTAFEKAYDWIENSADLTPGNDTMVLIYQYRGDPTATPNSDGTLQPFTTGTTEDLPGQDYVIQSVVRRLGDTKVDDELQPKVVEGRVFYVRMTQLVFNTDGELEVSTLADNKIADPRNPGTAVEYENYPEAVVAFQAEFYVMKSSLVQYVRNGFEIDKRGKPVFTRNMAVRR
ncbi:type II secretion system protein [Verrucomicrobiaceae bacterium R5-34]|uniref:Type II secretion system protein n=1 Tax=Oceaniferula flava TaxID=2800421 RepID=A0AAE2SAE4_9BACT|nr:type II secretion system protein [Oceaniferula flavus]MBK1831548.1 type II secretion system protein [Verrucomicrobiaceae bacterium R5-34]MBK1854213.1 type II secretion system protein [Oceaniferula flavus]MBM1135519.1 type II secretion system protein [Oceaniferula flavus]